MAVSKTYALTAGTPENISNVEQNFVDLLAAMNNLVGDVTGSLDANLVSKITATALRIGSYGGIVSTAASNTGFYGNYNPSTDRLVDTSVPGWRIQLNASGDLLSVGRAAATAGSPSWTSVLTLGPTGVIGAATATPGANTVTSATIVDGTIAPGDIGTLPHVRVYHSVDQTVADNTLTALAFNSERWDSGTSPEQHSTSITNSRLYCKQAGLYQITGSVVWNIVATPASATSVRNLSIRVNGSTEIAINGMHEPGTGLGAPQVFTTVTSQYRLAVNDYVELLAFQTNGTSMTIPVVANYSPEFMMAWIGP